MRIAPLAATLGLTVALTACGSDGSPTINPNPSGACPANLGETIVPSNVSCLTFQDRTAIVIPAGDYDVDMTWSSEFDFFLDGPVFIGVADASGNAVSGSEAALTILPGTRVFGSNARLSFLAIRPGSQIFADGTAAEPIVFTSSQETARSPGDWGGLIISGNAPVNCGAPCAGEGDTGNYGSVDQNADESSGILRYVRVEFAGRRLTPTNELNGIAFQGVGSGTVVENIHLHMVADDGIEFFGGTVNAKRILLTGVGDDSLDWTFGWTGKLQFVVAQQYELSEVNRGIEADSNEDAPAAVPVSDPTISNMTLIGVVADELEGILLRRGSRATIANSVVAGFGRCLSLSGADDANVQVLNSLLNCPDETDGTTDAALTALGATASAGTTIADPGLPAGAYFDEELFEAEPNLTVTFRPDGAAAAATGADFAFAGSDTFFEDVPYRGGVGTTSGSDWTMPWIDLGFPVF